MTNLTNEDKKIISQYCKAASTKRQAKSILKNLRSTILQIFDKTNKDIIEGENGEKIRRVIKDNSKIHEDLVEKFLRKRGIWTKYTKTSVDWEKLNRDLDNGTLDIKEFNKECKIINHYVELRTK